jgi:formylglycine-generating enzyme required for sulfatase activity
MRWEKRSEIPLARVLQLAGWLCLLAVPRTGPAQDMFASYLAAKRSAQPPQTVLSLYGYPGSTNEVQYAEALGGTNSWEPLTQVILTNSSITITDQSPRQAAQRFYRALSLGGTALAAPDDFGWVPPGRFLMGSPDTEEDRNSDEGPQTLVILTRGFYLCKHLVTQGEYAALMGNNPSWFVGDTNRPVEFVSWYDATNYCYKLTEREQSIGRLSAAWSYRLPTEAEWEYACRAGTTTRFSFGDDPGYTELPKYGWYDANSYTTNKPPGASYFMLGRYYMTHPVKQKLPNSWGLYDMYGDVSEWCQDWFGFYPGGTVLDPQGPAAGTERIVRSGSWYDDPYALRSAFRFFSEPENTTGIYGFRVVLAPAR